MLNTILAIMLLVFLLMAFVGDLLQYLMRIAASLFDQPNLSTHLVSLSMLVNRIGAASSLLLIGFFIDQGIAPVQLIFIYCGFSLTLAVLYFLAGLNASQSLILLRPLVMRYYKIEIAKPKTKKNAIPFRPIPNDIALIFALSLCGFLLPSVAAAIFPDYRATLLQTGFILNSIATLYFALKIEKDLAVTLNSTDTDRKWEAFVEFMFARSIGCIITTFVLPLILLAL